MVEINLKKEGDVDVLEVIGEVDASSSIQLDNALKNAIESGDGKLLIDCKSLDYISSAGLGVFMSYIEDINAKGAKMIIVGLNDKVKNVFNILGLDQLLETAASKEEGTERMK